MLLQQSMAQAGVNEFVYIPPHGVIPLWSWMEPLIERVITKTTAPETPEGIRRQLIDGSLHGFALDRKSLICLRFLYHYDLKIIEIPIYAGSLEHFETAWNYVNQLAKHHDCTDIIGYGRTGWDKAVKKIDPDVEIYKDVRLRVKVK